jgi:hypothetical protein
VTQKIDFEATAELRKWISLRNERIAGASSPYLVVAGTLGECLTAFMRKPSSQQHLYEIHTKAQPPLVAEVLESDLIAELARLREFL